VTDRVTTVGSLAILLGSVLLEVGSQSCGSCGGGGYSGGGGGGRSMTCYNCNQDGHISRDCPEQRQGGGGGGGSGHSITCYNCNKEGHMSRECPEGRQGGGGGY
jgi:hypothetical protein